MAETPQLDDSAPAPPQVPPRLRVHPLLWILLAGVVVRGLLLIWFAGEPLHPGDELDYDELAVHLVAQGQFVLEGQTCSMRPPLYPAFVAAVYACCGLANYQAVRALQAALALATVALVYFLGRRLYGRRVGLWAAGLYCFYPSMLGQANLLMSETLFTFWLVLACLVVARSLERESIGWLGAAGVVIGLAALTRSVLWLFPPVLALYVLVAWKTGFRRRLAAACLMVAAFAATIAPWSIRCSRLEGTFVAIDVMGGRNFMMGNYEHTPLERMWDVISIPDAPGAEVKPWYRVLAGENPGFRELTQGQRDKLAMRRGVRFVLENPGVTLRRDVVKFFNFWQLERSLVAGMGRGWFGDLPLCAVLPLTALIFGAYAAAMIAGIFGAAMAPAADRRLWWLLLLVIVYVCGLHTLVFAHSRYHLPLVPLVLIFASAAVVYRREIWRRRRTRPFWIAAALSLVLAGGWAWEILAVDLQRFMKILKP